MSFKCSLILEWSNEIKKARPLEGMGESSYHEHVPESSFSERLQGAQGCANKVLWVWLLCELVRGPHPLRKSTFAISSFAISSRFANTCPSSLTPSSFSNTLQFCNTLFSSFSLSRTRYSSSLPYSTLRRTPPLSLSLSLVLFYYSDNNVYPKKSLGPNWYGPLSPWSQKEK